MRLETFKNFADFELLDSGEGYRLEKWNGVILARPDPQAIWPRHLPQSRWEGAHAIFHSSRGEEKGRWELKKPVPKPWIAEFKGVRFLLKLTNFKHTGLFAEQAAQWEWMINTLEEETQNRVPPSDQVRLRRASSLSKESLAQNESEPKTAKLKILNLFAYTGGATSVLAKHGCFVTHVDASKPSITWASDNHRLNGLPKDSVRWILDDAAKFVNRELKRGASYDAIIMDPPAFGHSPTGKVWKFNQDLPGLLQNCVSLLSPDARFLVINGYATNSSALALNNVLEDAMRGRKGMVDYGELCLKQADSRMISTGIFARWANR